jgi:hypothetical protein
MKFKEIDGLCRGGLYCVYTTFGKHIIAFGDAWLKYGDWEIVRIKANNDLLVITIEEPSKMEGKKDNEQENLLHKTETNRLADVGNRNNNADHGQRKCNNNLVSNATGDIPDDNKGKNNVSERETSTTGEKTMTLVDRILEMMYQALVEGNFDQELGNYPLYEFGSSPLSRLKEFYDSDIQVTLSIKKENSTINEKHYISTIISDATEHGQKIGFKNGFLIGMLFGNQTNSKPVIFNQPKENNPNGYNH